MYDRVLAVEPGHPDALCLSGLLYLDLGQMDEAGRRLVAAVEAAPSSQMARAGLGTYQLKVSDWRGAVETWGSVVQSTPAEPAALRNLGLALKNVGRFEDARGAFRKALELQRGLGRTPISVDRTTNLSKLRHDRDQYRTLAARYPEREDFGVMARAFNDEIAKHPGKGAFEAIATDGGFGARLGAVYNRLVFEPNVVFPSVVISPIGPQDPDAGHYVFDDFLTGDALLALRKICEESTIWFEAKDHGGHVGTYFDEGFDHPLLLRIAEAVLAQCPEILKDQRLRQIWAYKYAPTGEGTRMHADQASWTLNLWISDPGPAAAGGGLVMSDVLPPDNWNFDRYNGDQHAIEAWLRESGANFHAIPHRPNRAVLFRSNTFHRTEPFDFPEKFQARRVNISFLFGPT